MAKKSKKPVKDSRPCPSGFYKNERGICVQAGIGPEYKP